MAKVNDLLTSRFKKASSKLSKMTNLAEKSSQGNLSSFSGVFRVIPLNENEEEDLRNLLSEYSTELRDIASDLKYLSAITSEVKAINNQAAILHGERIRKAQEILADYRDGAFSSWLKQTYGNRQTPYNFLQYYQLYTSLEKPLQLKADKMPRQAVYTLASRNCSHEEKEEIIEKYKGESKKELLLLIRQKFPLAVQDKRKSNDIAAALKGLREVEKLVKKASFRPTYPEQKQIKEVLRSIKTYLER